MSDPARSSEPAADARPASAADAAAPVSSAPANTSAPGNASAPANADSGKAAAKPAAKESWKDTLESIAFALILAFVFRAFVVEAFVIPTGSMAATLNGKHYEFFCDRCGYGPWSLSHPKDEDNGRRLQGQPQPDPVCPNCNHHIRDWRAESVELIPPPKPRPADKADAEPSPRQLLLEGLAQIPRTVEEATLRRGPGGRLQLDFGKRGAAFLKFSGPIALAEVTRVVGDDGARETGHLLVDGAFQPGQKFKEADGTDTKIEIRAVTPLGELDYSVVERPGRLDALIGRRVAFTGWTVRTPEGVELLPESIRTADGAEPLSGDRILVLKYLYEFSRPQRWDVVVFRWPGRPTENYIKRLVGLPGESLMILDGDVFVKPGGGDWRIARKPVEAPRVQDVLWNPVYLADFPPKDGDYHAPTVKVVKRWEASPDAGEAWTGLSTPVFSLSAADDDRLRGVRYVQYLNPAGERPGAPRVEVPVFDAHSYNGVRAGHELGDPSDSTLNVVSDLRLSADLVWKGGAGFWQGVLTKHRDRWTVRYWADGRVELFQTDVNAAVTEADQPVLTRTAAPPPVGRPVTVEFYNADHFVRFRVGGVEVFGQKYEPDLERLRAEAAGQRRAKPIPPRAEMAGRAAAFDLRHIRLDRDIYYTQGEGPGGLNSRGTGGRAITLNDGAADPTRSREYFMLGDNSGASSDSRFWDDPNARSADKPAARHQPGTVPEENLTGKAFFVYWPAGYPLAEVKWLSWRLIPRASEWRLIR
jgi:signal peptidase I